MQPVAELVELSRRWASDGRSIRLNDAIARGGGTLRRTGSLRHRQTKVSPPKPCVHFFLYISIFFRHFFYRVSLSDAEFRRFLWRRAITTPSAARCDTFRPPTPRFKSRRLIFWFFLDVSGCGFVAGGASVALFVHTLTIKGLCPFLL